MCLFLCSYLYVYTQNVWNFLERPVKVIIFTRTGIKKFWAIKQVLETKHWTFAKQQVFLNIEPCLQYYNFVNFQ